MKNLRIGKTLITLTLTGVITILSGCTKKMECNIEYAPCS
jgi:hypothetical protein